MTPAEIAAEALTEDAREGSHFDEEGFSNFNPEELPVEIALAWSLYERIVYGGEPRSILAEDAA